MVYLAVLNFFKGFRLNWYEWLALGVLGLLIIFSYLTYQRLNSTQLDLEATKQALTRSQEAVNVWRGLRESDNKVLQPYYSAIENALRRESVREQQFTEDYLRVVREEREQEERIEKQMEEATAAITADVETDKPAEETDIYVKPIPEPALPPPAPKPVNHGARVNVIIDSMWETYCDGIPTDDCITP